MRRTTDLDETYEALGEAEDDRLYQPGTAGYVRLLAHARGYHGTRPGTEPHPDCEACQTRENLQYLR